MIYKGILEADWHLMLPKERLMYNLLIKKSQTDKALTIGGVCPLNMVTCVTVNSLNCNLENLSIESHDFIAFSDF